MIIWVLYDIVKDKSRTKAAKYCQQAGLYRVQFSCFLGTLTPNQRDTLQLQLEDLIDPDTDRVYIFPMSKGELQQTALLGQAFDRKLVTDEIRALFF
ncbi:CRISPR-associated endonuclease Cas2 [Fibrella sp. WM1]|uniref:CRISPR-associated endonuclease Cas2 n=1 Tax=Fibrella musci TaxID=3242485 RepID=UPI003520DD2E